MSFGVFGGDSYVGNNGDTFTIVKSTLEVGTYNSVLQGLNGTLSGSTITGTNWSVTNTTGNFTNLNGAPFSYSLAAADSGSWNLVVLSAATNISGIGTLYQSSNVGTSVNSVFDGGTLQMAAGSISSNFTVNANNGVIDQNSVTSTFSGIISDAVAGTPGSITITNSGSGGSVTFSEVNTFTGSTTIGSDATLALSGSGSISTSSSVANSGTFNISNTTSGASVSAIAGGGTVVLGTKVLTITNASGNLSGVVSGSGGLNIAGGGQTLSAANTFTGSTTIGSGATLVLSGVGSIAPTSVLTNNGTFNIQPKSSNISVNGNYVQSSTGSLQMGLTDTNNPKLFVGGTSSLAGSLLVTADSGIYSAGRYTLITSTDTLSGTFDSFSSNLSSVAPSFGYALEYDTNNVYLFLASLGPSAADTQSSIGLSANRLKGIYNLQSTAVVNGLTYDCQLFDVNNACLSTGGRYSNNHGATGYTTSALLIGAYRLNKNVRLGAWLDQNLSTNTVTGTNLSNSKPLFGVFGAWAENPSGEGYEVKVSAGYGDKDLTVTRDVIGTSEAGFGSTRLNSQAVSTVSSYGFKLNNDLLASPYVGMQYSRVASSGYTEASTADVTAPLTYGRLSQENVSILAGLKLSAKLDSKTALFGSVDIEQNINNRSGQYSATGVDGLTAVDFNSNVQKTRATASAGVSYDIDKKQRVSLSGIYREEAFNPTATTSVFVTYTVGF